MGSKRLGTMKPTSGKHRRRQEVLCPLPFLSPLPILAVHSNSWFFSFHTWLVKHLTDHGSWRFPEWFESQTKYLINSGSFPQTEIQDKEMRELSKGKMLLWHSWKNKYLLMSYCVQGVISTGIWVTEPLMGEHLLQCCSTPHLWNRWVSLLKHL